MGTYLVSRLPLHVLKHQLSLEKTHLQTVYLTHTHTHICPHNPKYTAVNHTFTHHHQHLSHPPNQHLTPLHIPATSPFTSPRIQLLTLTKLEILSFLRRKRRREEDEAREGEKESSMAVLEGGFYRGEEPNLPRNAHTVSPDKK